MSRTQQEIVQLQHDVRRLKAMLSMLPCPRDTDGDGNCGQRACPWCGVEWRWT